MSARGARVYFMKRVKDCKDEFIMSPQDVYSEDGHVYSVYILQFSCFTQYNRMQSKHKQTKCEHSRRNSSDYSFLSRYHYTKKTISNSSLNSHVYWDTL